MNEIRRETLEEVPDGKFHKTDDSGPPGNATKKLIQTKYFR